jgi:hypothetical protein
VSRLLILALLPLFLYGKGGFWKQEVEVSLKKDEFQEVKVFDPLREKQLFFRWTLYINEGLVVIAHYDRYPHQYVLYKKDYRRDSFRVRLGGKREEILVQFSDFDLKKKKAKFTIYTKSRNVEVVEKELAVDSE